MRDLTPDELERLAQALDVGLPLIAERHDVLIDIATRLSWQDPEPITSELPALVRFIDRWLSDQIIDDDSRDWALARVALLVGEYLVRNWRGTWFVNEWPDMHYFARVVVGRFEKCAAPTAMVDPFEVARDYIARAPGRSLIEYTDELDRYLTSLGPLRNA